jgi:hypothetical protein
MGRVGARLHGGAGGLKVTVLVRILDGIRKGTLTDEEFFAKIRAQLEKEEKKTS